MRRVAVLGRGGAGKSTLARQLGDRTGLPVVELDTLFWDADLNGLPRAEWRSVQTQLAAENRWILDGDLGPFDDLAPRLARADTVVVLDLPLRVCIPRILRRGRRRLDFWQWVINWRRVSRPLVRGAIDAHASGAEVIVLTSTRDVASWLGRHE